MNQVCLEEALNLFVSPLEKKLTDNVSRDECRIELQNFVGIYTVNVSDAYFPLRMCKAACKLWMKRAISLNLTSYDANGCSIYSVQRKPFRIFKKNKLLLIIASPPFASCSALSNT